MEWAMQTIQSTGANSLLEIVQTVNLLLQSVAIIAAGWWTYRLFVKQRLTKPKLGVSHRFCHVPITHNKYLVRVTVAMQNKGDILFEPSRIHVHLQQVVPCPDSIIEEVLEQKKIDMIGTEINWPEIAEMTAIADFSRPAEKVDPTYGELYVTKIEPGEKDECYFDFLIDRHIDAIFVYSRIEGKVGLPGSLMRRFRKTTGWNQTSFYVIDPDTYKQRDELTKSFVLETKGEI